MIKVLNRELLIPNNERYLGTEYDTHSAVRMFQLDRVCSDGVDIADLLFKLDLLYPEDRTIYTLTNATTITSGVIFVNKIEFLKKKKTAGSYVFTYDGSAWSLSGTAVTLSEYGIEIITGTPASGNTITVTLATSSERYDVVDLVKDVTDEKIYLHWIIGENQLSVPGTVYIQIRAFNNDGTVNWSSYQSALFVEDAINAGIHVSSLSELEQLEIAVNAALTNMATQVEAATSAASTATTKAGEASTSAANAATSESNAASSASSAASDAASALSSKNAAASSESNAATSASTATTAAGTATTKAGEASTSATNAATSASNAATSASTATSKASEASTSASNAAASESSVAANAAAAAASAASASNSESTASTAATNAAASAVSAAASAAEAASYTGKYVKVDGAQSFTDAEKAQGRANLGVGDGTGDMVASVYDPTNKHQDIFSYADTKQAKEQGKGLSTNDYDDTEKGNVADNTAARHSHSNKALLDTYTQTEANIADAVTKKHEHSNKNLLDTYDQTNANLSDAVNKKHEHSNKALLDSYTQTNANIADAVTKKHEHRKTTLSLAAASWSGSASPYTQTITITGSTANTKVDLQPDATVINRLIEDGCLALYVENNNNVLTVKAVGEKPSADISVQATYSEVVA